MISKELIITEEERKEIKTLYGLIREQEASQKNPELTLDLSGTFGSGKYKLPEKADRVDDLINKIREFKKQNAGSVIEISVNSGESQVPNYDREKYPSTGNDKVDFTNEKITFIPAATTVDRIKASYYLDDSVNKWKKGQTIKISFKNNITNILTNKINIYTEKQNGWVLKNTIDSSIMLSEKPYVEFICVDEINKTFELEIIR